MFNKYLKKVSLTNLFAGYRVRKSTVVKAEQIYGMTQADAYQYTYINEGLSLFILDASGKYFDVGKKVLVEEVTSEKLVSQHIAYGNQNISLKDFPSYNQDEIFGVFGIRPLIAIYTNLFEEQYEVLISNKSEQVKLLNEYTLFEADKIVKKCNKILGNDNNILLIPPVKLDLNDSLKSVFGFEKDFLNLISNKTPEQVITIIKLKVKEYEHNKLD